MPLALLVLWSAAVGSGRIEWVHQVPERTLSVALVQGNIAQDLKFADGGLNTSLRQYAELSEPLWRHDLVVWPETAIPLIYQQAGPVLAGFEATALQYGSTLVSGIFFRDGERIYNSLTTLGNGSGTWHKQKLVPFGEYVPLRGLLANVLQIFALPMSSLAPGPDDQQLPSVAGLRYAPFICYEVVYPEFVRRHARDADFLLTVSNDTWFGASWGPLQHLQMAAMRARENGRYMVRATNNGVSALISEKGEIVARTPQFETATLSGTVRLFTGSTPWSAWGNWPLLLLCWGVVLASLYRLRHAPVTPPSA
jgi:apolipoprotein N-acyltransferase